MEEYKSVNAENEEFVTPRIGVKINLQLFAGDPEEEDLSEEGWEDFSDDEEGSEEEETETNDSEESEEGNDEEEQGEKEPETAEPDKSKPKQSKDKNAIFAQMRRKAEAEAEAKAAAKYQKDLEALENEKYKLEEEKRLNSIPQEAIWQRADAEGVSEDAARRMLQLEEKEKILADRERRIQRKSEIELQKQKLKGELYFEELEPEIDKFLVQYPDTNAEGAFHYLRSVKLPELLKEKSKAAEKRTIANIQDKAKRGNISSDGDDTGKFKSTGLTKKISEAWGFNQKDIEDVQKHNSKRSKEFRKI